MYSRIEIMDDLKWTGRKLYKDGHQLSQKDIEEMGYWELRRIYRQARHTTKMMQAPQYGFMSRK